MKAIRKEFKDGAFAVIKAFKDLTVKHANITTPTFTTDTYFEQYTTTVNKHKVVGANLTAYSTYCSKTKTIKIIMNHTTITVPDYDRFRTYHATGLIHNLDSFIMDSTMKTIQDRGEWCIAIHDAGLVLPGTDMREAYIAQLENLRTNRHKVLNSYLQSIGATDKASKIAYTKLLATVEPLDDSISFSISALK